MTKTVSLADDAYEALAAVRLPGESFSDVARRLARQEASKWVWDPHYKLSITDRDAAQWKRAIREERDRSSRPRA